MECWPQKLLVTRRAVAHTHTPTLITHTHTPSSPLSPTHPHDKYTHTLMTHTHTHPHDKYTHSSHTHTHTNPNHTHTLITLSTHTHPHHTHTHPHHKHTYTHHKQMLSFEIINKKIPTCTSVYSTNISCHCFSSSTTQYKFHLLLFDFQFSVIE